MASTLLMGTLGAAGMYYFDSRLGRRRRALLRDKLVRLAHQAQHGVELGTRDLAHRLKGMAAQGRHVVRSGDAEDRVIEARVRSALGRIVARPRAIHVVSSAGIVHLSGPVTPREHDQLLGAVRLLRGVYGIDNALAIQLDSGEATSAPGAGSTASQQSLSGLATSHGHTFELMQRNWSPGARLLAAVGGGYMAACGLIRGGAIGNLKAALGMTLFLRGASNLDMGRLLGFAAPDGNRRGIDVHKTINIRADVGEVFGFFSNYDNFPLFMRNVRDVRDLGDGRSHWTVAGPAGVPVAWEAILTDYHPNRCIAWETTGNATIGNEGVIRFDENPDGSTRVDIRLAYNPPGGLLAHAIASLLRADPKSEMDEDLARLKTLIEKARIPHDAAQHPAATAPANQGPPIQPVEAAVAAPSTLL